MPFFAIQNQSEKHLWWHRAMGWVPIGKRTIYGWWERQEMEGLVPMGGTWVEVEFKE